MFADGKCRQSLTQLGDRVVDAAIGAHPSPLWGEHAHGDDFRLYRRTGQLEDDEMRRRLGREW